MYLSGLIQKYRPWKYRNKDKIKECIIDETTVKAGSELIWLWIITEPTNKQTLSFYISKERNTFVAERILSQWVNKYGLHFVSSDGGTRYPQTCKFLKLKHHLHSSFEKSIIERTIQYIKDRIESFDEYFPCKKNRCKLIMLNCFVA